MTIDQAFGQLIETSTFRQICKQKEGKGAKYRVYKGRYMKGKLNTLAMVALLLQHHYVVTAQLPKNKKLNK